MEPWTDLIKSVGVPFVICMYVLHKLCEKLDRVRIEINALTMVLAKKNGITPQELDEAKRKIMLPKP